MNTAEVSSKDSYTVEEQILTLISQTLYRSLSPFINKTITYLHWNPKKKKEILFYFKWDKISTSFFAKKSS